MQINAGEQGMSFLDSGWIIGREQNLAGSSKLVANAINESAPREAANPYMKRVRFLCKA
jgi:hypothetical protein